MINKKDKKQIEKIILYKQLASTDINYFGYLCHLFLAVSLIAFLFGGYKSVIVMVVCWGLMIINTLGMIMTYILNKRLWKKING